MNVPKLLAGSILLCASALAACAPSVQHIADSPPAQPVAAPVVAVAPVHRQAAPAPRLRRCNRALFARPHAPDCEFKEPDLKTVDADMFARLKLDYERQCYQRAEAAMRERLRQLQTSLGRCEVSRAARAADSDADSRQFASR